MANEELGKLSPEQLQRLGNVISEAKSLTSQQEEIIGRVLSGEEDIGELRISYLEEYFDIYSKNLDMIARKYSKLNDAFLLANELLNESFKSAERASREQQRREKTERPKDKPDGSESASATTTSRTTRATKASREETRFVEAAMALRDALTASRASSAANSDEYATTLRDALKASNFTAITSGDTPSVSRTEEVSPAAGEVAATRQDNASAINDISSALIEALRASHYTPTPGSGGADAGAGDEGRPPVVPDVTVRTFAAEDEIAGLSDAVVDLSAVMDALNVREAEIDAARKERITKHLTTLLTSAKEAHDAQVALALARNKTEEDLERQRVEYKIARIQEVVDAETKAQQLMDEINTQLDYARNAASRRELGKLRAEQIAAEENAKSLEEIKTAMAERRQALELEAMANNNGKLRAADAAAIEKQLKDEFDTKQKHLDELTAKRFRAALEAKKLEEFKEANQEAVAAFEKKKAIDIVNEEIKLRKKYSGEELAKKLKDLKKQKNEEYVLDEKNQKKLEKLQLEAAKKEKRDSVAATDSKIEHAASFQNLSKEDNLVSRFKELKSITDSVDDEDKGAAQMAVAIKAISSLMAQLESKIDSIAQYQGGIDTRLQGSNNKKSMGSYWNQLTKDMMSVGAVTPFFKQEDFANNIKELVNKGISFDLKQRAFLMTVQEKIANTFNVADGTLLRLIRIQQEDSTAGRLGMESALNSFLNNMYETSEYLTDVAASVRGSLEEMEALMGGAAATEVEYQVQKWMGSLYSVGMSSSSVQAIAGALGQIASGQIDALTGNGAGNLLVMAANNADIPIAEILSEGLDAENTNKLLQATVNYLAEIAESSKGNNVVQQQLANVFGVKASDLKAAVNLAKDNTTANIFGDYKTYGNLINQLYDMAGTMFMRTSIGEMMTNIWENGQYTIASSMANNPISYLTYKMAGLLEDTTGGIALPFLNVMGFGVDLETTVADLMRVASVGTGILGSIGPMISGLFSSFSGRSMLNKMGIKEGSGLTITPRGEISGGGLTGGGAQTTSGSATVGNGSGSDLKDSTVQGAEDDKKKQMVEAKEEAEDNQVDVLNSYVIKIYELLDKVASGSRAITVKVAGYGLTGGGLGSGDTALGGVPGISSDTTSSSGQVSDKVATDETGSVTPGTGSGNVSLGGWVMG